MYLKQFQQGDKVTYIGHRFAQKLSGALGIVDAHVRNSKSGIVVTFGSDSYVMDESHLTKFQGRMRETEPVADEAPKDVEVVKRKGAKRRNQESE